MLLNNHQYNCNITKSFLSVLNVGLVNHVVILLFVNSVQRLHVEHLYLIHEFVTPEIKYQCTVSDDGYILCLKCHKDGSCKTTNTLTTMYLLQMYSIIIPVLGKPKLWKHFTSLSLKNSWRISHSCLVSPCGLGFFSV